MADVRFDTYYTVEELDEITAGLATEYPGLVRRSELGRSYEGRPIWLMTITDEGAGPDTDKPGYWVDGNLHASEVAGAMASLYMVNRLLTGYGHDDLITRLLRRTAFYIVPRLNPDGAVRLFQTPPRDVRSGVRAYPYNEDDDGLFGEDIDGDGRILQMRVPDENGLWKISARDPRVMIRRGPLEEGGTYYRVFEEGLIRNFDGHLIRIARPLEGLDFNRNFPAAWEVEAVQRGAGPYPVSESETRAIAAFFAAHPNIFGAINYHTAGGLYFRPPSDRPDSDLAEEDAAVYKMLGEQTRAITGYPAISTYDEFGGSGRATLHGGFQDWLYEDLGIFSFSTELWDYPKQAGIEREDKPGAFQAWYYNHPEEDDLAVMRWVQEEQGGQGWVQWYAYQHPQLGPVELGGWDGQFVLYNPPPKMLEAEIAKTCEFNLAHASLAARLELRHLEAEPLDPGRHRVVLVVENAGFLSTSGSRRARERGAARTVRAELLGGDVVDGPRRIDLGHLEGRSNKLRLESSSATDNRAKAQWLVRAEPGTELEVAVFSDRAGTVRRRLTV